MKLTKKFWAWLGQALALAFFILRVDLIVSFFKLLPFADVSQLYPFVPLLVLVVAGWGVWLVWRAYIGFYRKMDFLIDDTRHRW